MHFNFENSYLELPDSFYSLANPTPVIGPQIVLYNTELAQSLGVSSEGSAAVLSGNSLADGSTPFAQAYAGHQFGYFTMLGDGRAIVLGEHLTATGERFDIQLKGAGRTKYSRGGDGRAALGPMLREYIISEAMHALGVPSTRSLAVVASGETVRRESELPGAILTRVAKSHIRVGTFEFAAGLQNVEQLRAFTRYTIKRHFPELLEADHSYLRFLQKVVELQASLIASWMHLGFVHGVMNTDNMSICGETIDYGPCAFIDRYDPATVFSSIDRNGRYSFYNQPTIAQWNLARLAESILPLLDESAEAAVQLATDAVNSFGDSFGRAWLSGMRQKLGLTTEETDDFTLAEQLLTWMYSAKLDYTRTFWQLSNTNLQTSAQPFQAAEFQSWYERWLARLGREHSTIDAATALMRRHNPGIIPRNHQVEAALVAATNSGDLSQAEALLNAVRQPFSEDESLAMYREEPPPEALPYRTFCGT